MTICNFFYLLPPGKFKMYNMAILRGNIHVTYINACIRLDIRYVINVNKVNRNIKKQERRSKKLLLTPWLVKYL